MSPAVEGTPLDRRVLVTGGSGFIGRAVVRQFASTGQAVVATGSRPAERVGEIVRQNDQQPRGSIACDSCDFDRPSDIPALLDRHHPSAIVHAAATPDLADCERDPDRARRVNVEASEVIARWASHHGCRLICISTDQVFDGLQAPYTEDADPRPVHIYGRSKVEAEQRTLDACPDATVVRISLVYGDSPTGRRSASEQVLNALREGRELRLFTDEYRTPILVDDVARAIGELLDLTDVRRLHLAGPDRVSRYGFGLAVAEAFGLDGSVIAAIRQCDVDLGTPRPPDLSLDTGLARQVLRCPPRSLREGLAELA